MLNEYQRTRALSEFLYDQAKLDWLGRKEKVSTKYILDIFSTISMHCVERCLKATACVLDLLSQNPVVNVKTPPYSSAPHLEARLRGAIAGYLLAEKKALVDMTRSVWQACKSRVSKRIAEQESPGRHNI